MTVFALIAGMALVTYGIRYPIIVVLGRVNIPQSFFDGLRFVPPAVLAAIIAPALLMPGGTIDISLENTRLLAGLVAIAVAWRTRNLLLTIVLGMATLWVLQFFF